MRKAVRWLLILLAVAIAAVLIAIPRYAPPYVERFAVEKLAEIGIDAKVNLGLGYCWRNGPGIEGVVNVSVPNTPWCVVAKFGASCCEWSAKVKVSETRFDENDPLVKMLMKKYPVAGVSNLVVSGSVALDAQAERTFAKPVPIWKVSVPIRDVSASAMANDQERSVGSLSATFGASGIADHVDIAPVFLRAKSASVGRVCLTNFYATVRATEKALIVNEAGAEFCGGKVGVYSLYLDAKDLDAGFTVFLDGVDAGKALAYVNGFQGEASGKLHGKCKAFVKKGGKAVWFSDTFLYSTPGETGKLRMANPEMVTDNLAYAGIDDGTRANVSDALADLDYKVLRLDFRRTGEKSARLSVQVGGTATLGKTTVPVDLTINLNGELEQLINAGLGYSAKLKGKKK